MSTVFTNSTNSPEEMNHTWKTREFQNIRASNPLNGKNYLKWSQFVRTYLKEKGKLSHLLITRPTKNDPNIEASDEEDLMIMSWLWDSMNHIISDACMFFGTTSEIWEYDCSTYSKTNDTTQIYEIKVKTSTTKQGDKVVIKYASLLQNPWKELDHYRIFEMKCPKDAAILKSFIEKCGIYDFLAGLNHKFDQMRIQILGKEETSPLEETNFLV